MSKVLLESILNCESKKELAGLWDIVKNSKTAITEVGIAIEDAQRLGFASGKKVMLSNDPIREVGVVTGFNTSTVGFYTGDRYPIIVKWKRGTFEYGAGSLTLEAEEE